MTNKDIEEMVEYHGGFIFDGSKNSSGVDESGEEYDHSFVTENGRVSWEKNENDTYLVSYIIFKDAEHKIEKRILTFDQLKDWFYSPTIKYYEENISSVPVQ